jgi:hypothetical protein
MSRVLQIVNYFLVEARNIIWILIQVDCCLLVILGSVCLGSHCQLHCFYAGLAGSIFGGLVCTLLTCYVLLGFLVLLCLESLFVVFQLVQGSLWLRCKAYILSNVRCVKFGGIVSFAL